MLSGNMSVNYETLREDNPGAAAGSTGLDGDDAYRVHIQTPNSQQNGYQGMIFFFIS